MPFQVYGSYMRLSHEIPVETISTGTHMAIIAMSVAAVAIILGYVALAIKQSR